MTGSSTMLCAAFKPVLTGGAIVGSRKGDSFFCIGAKIEFAVTVRAISGMTSGMDAVRASTVDLLYLAGHLIMPATVLGSFSFKVTHG